MSIQNLIKKETKRQKRFITLIPSENYVSKAVRSAQASVFTNKYAEGYPGQRYYNGNGVADELENEVKGLVLKAFKLSPDDWAVNVQPHSGSPANLAAYLSIYQPGDKIMAMSLAHGGHLTHGHYVSWTGKLFQFRHYGVNGDGWLDYEQIKKEALAFGPKLIVCGATAYSRTIDFEKFKIIADSVGAKLMADVSHICGLIIGGVHPSPFPYADIVTSTTHKTLRGPRGAFIVCRKELGEAVDKAVFPGLQGGPHLHTIAAMGVALQEALKPSFRKYAQQVVKNAQKLAAELGKLGFKIISGGTDNHLMLINVTPLGLTGDIAADRLESAGIIVNKNSIPDDPNKPRKPSGIRLGTPAVTTRGLKEKDMIKLARKIWSILRDDG